MTTPRYSDAPKGNERAFACVVLPMCLTATPVPPPRHLVVRIMVWSLYQDQTGVGSTPPTFRMYTTGDIIEALGAEVVMRARDVERDVAGKVQRGEIDVGKGCRGRRAKRQAVSVVEMQVTWVGGYTYLLGWLDVVEG